MTAKEHDVAMTAKEHDIKRELVLIMLQGMTTSIMLDY